MGGGGCVLLKYKVTDRQTKDDFSKLITFWKYFLIWRKKRKCNLQHLIDLGSRYINTGNSSKKSPKLLERLSSLIIELGLFNGTVTVISSDPLFKDAITWFTTVHYKNLSDQLLIINQCLCFFKLFFSHFGFSSKEVLRNYFLFLEAMENSKQ